MLGYVLKVFPPLPSETFILNEILVLEGLGHTLQIFALRRSDHQDRAFSRVESRVTILADRTITGLLKLALSNMETFLTHPWPYLGTALKLCLRKDIGSLKDFLLGARLCFHVRRAGITHLHAHYATASAQVARFANLLTGVTYSFTGHALDIFVGDGKLEDVVRDASFVVTVCEYNKLFLRSRFRWLSPDRIKLVVCGVDAERFKPSVTRKRDGCFTFISVGRLVEKKGFHYLVKASAELRERGHSFRCLLVGDGPLMGDLRRQIRSLSLENIVILTGALPQDRVRKLLNQASAFVLPCVVASDGDRDSMPVVIKEAMAMELPIIASREVGVPEMLSDDCGVMFPPRDVRLLADAMELFLNCGSEALRDMGARARKTVLERFTIGKEVRKLEQLFREYVGW